MTNFAASILQANKYYLNMRPTYSTHKFVFCYYYYNTLILCDTLHCNLVKASNMLTKGITLCIYGVLQLMPRPLHIFFPSQLRLNTFCTNAPPNHGTEQWNIACCPPKVPDQCLCGVTCGVVQYAAWDPYFYGLQSDILELLYLHLMADKMHWIYLFIKSISMHKLYKGFCILLVLLDRMETFWLSMDGAFIYGYA